MLEKTMDMSKQHMTPIELWEIAVFINGQVPATQEAVRRLHKRSEREAMFLVRNAMERFGIFK